MRLGASLLAPCRAQDAGREGGRQKRLGGLAEAASREERKRLGTRLGSSGCQKRLAEALC